MGDSFYEYLLKAYLHNNKQEPVRPFSLIFIDRNYFVFIMNPFVVLVNNWWDEVLLRIISTLEEPLEVDCFMKWHIYHAFIQVSTSYTLWYLGLLVLGIYHNVTEDAERDLQDAKSLAYIYQYFSWSN